MSIPGWYSTLTMDMNLNGNFVDFFKSKLSKSTNKKLDEDLIAIFGRTNLSFLESLLSSNQKIRLKKELQSQKVRFQLLSSRAMKELISNNSVPSENLKKLYKELYEISVFKSINIHSTMIREIATYLLSLAMPFQASIYSSCYAHPQIKQLMDSQRKELKNTLLLIFNSMKGNQEDPIPGDPILPVLTLSQEQLLFKRAALISDGKTVSWGHLIYYWSSNSRKGSNFKHDINEHWSFAKLLIPKNTPSNVDGISTLFKEFVVDQTILKIAKLSCLGKKIPVQIAEQLKDLFSNSFTSQQNTIYFIDYLHQALSGEFSFEEALNMLNKLVPDQSRPEYFFLHTCSHFFHCRSKFEMKPEDIPLVFEMIHALSMEEIAIYDSPVIDKFPRLPFNLSAFISYFNKGRLTLKEGGSIILKFSRTCFPASSNLPCYLTLEEHINSLEKIENTFRICIPERFIADFLYYQTADDSLFEWIEYFVEIQREIETRYLSTLAIPLRLYKAWQEGVVVISNSISCNPNERFQPDQDRWCQYLFRKMELAILIQLSTYPMPFLQFSHFIPNKIEEISTVEPIITNLTSGPAKYCNWFIEEKTGQPTFCVSLLNSYKYPKTASTFFIPLNIDVKKSWTPKFLSILEAFIDSFGKEVLSEEEEFEWTKLNSNLPPYQLPDECLTIESPEMFDTILSHSPHLKVLWYENAQFFGEDLLEVKNKLFSFILSLRSQIKRSFYCVLDGIDSDINDLVFVGGGHLHDSQWRETCSQCNAFFEQAYAKIEIPSEISEMQLENGCLISIKSSPSALSSSENLIALEMKITDSRNSGELSILYQSFEDMKQYINLMHWHLHLLELIFHERLIVFNSTL